MNNPVNNPVNLNQLLAKDKAGLKNLESTYGKEALELLPLKLEIELLETKLAKPMLKDKAWQIFDDYSEIP